MAIRRPATLAAALVTALLLSACGGATGEEVADHGEPAAATAPAPAAADDAPTAEPPTLRTPAASAAPADADPSPEPTATPGATATAGPTPTPVPSEEAAPALQPVSDGDRGPAVRDVQTALDDLGYDPGPIDGVVGRRTTQALAAYQHAAGLDETGEADEDTVAGLATGEHAHEVLEPGDRGADVRTLQQTLADGPFDPGPVDGVYGTKTVQAVYALEKLAGVAVDGTYDGTDVHALSRLRDGDVGAASSSHDRRWVEVDLSRQLMAIYDGGAPDTPLLVSHVSTGNGERWCNDTAGCRVASTPTGSFTITRRIAGWRESSLDIGRLYNPLYFRGGIALHGALSVPTHPASHGCVRVPMHIAEYLPDLLPNGTPVEVHRSA